MASWRVLVAAIVGGIVVFMWSFVSHQLLGLDRMAFGPVKNAAEAAKMLSESATGRTARLFPEMAMDHPTEEQMKAAWAVWEKGPRGMIIVDAAPLTNAFPKLLATEFLSCVIAAFIVSIVATTMGGTYYGRVAMITLIGVFGWVAIDVSYWNWYRFPDGMTIASLIDQGVGWLLAGFPIAAIVRSKSRCARGPECGCGPSCGCAT